MSHRANSIKRLTLKENNLPPLSPPNRGHFFMSFRVDSFSEGRKTNLIELSTLIAYPFPLRYFHLVSLHAKCKKKKKKKK